MRRIAGLWSLLAAAMLLLPASAWAADNWDDGWDYLDTEEAFAYPEPETPAPADTVCLNGINHYGSPCTCPPIEPEEYPDLPDEPMVCENPFGDDESFLGEFKGKVTVEINFSMDLPIVVLKVDCDKCSVCDKLLSLCLAGAYNVCPAHHAHGWIDHTLNPFRSSHWWCNNACGCSYGDPMDG